jgi:hypothetical protein
MKSASIDPSALYKGQTIDGELVWEHFVNRKPDKLLSWIDEHGEEATAKAARLPYVLLQVRDWLERDRRELELPPLVMNTVGGMLNVLTDEKASAYLNDQAFQGLRRHQRATGRLMTSVDETKLMGAAKRQHQNRINVHSFIAASAQGAQRQLRLLERAGKQPPKIEG